VNSRQYTLALFAALVGVGLGACNGGGGGGSQLIDRGVCDTLIECASSLAPETRDEYIAAYGEGGMCWMGGPNQWAACRNACRQGLDALNLAGQVTGETCGTCMTDADCGSLGPNATCQDGVCVGASGEGGSEGGSEGEGEGESGTDTDAPGCTPNWDPPEECLRFVECIGALAPGQQAAADAMYGAEGTCWCGTDTEASECYDFCLAQLEDAIADFPTVSACHESSCSLAELDPNQPYGPVVNGSCPSWDGAPQLPLVEPANVPGSVCSPACSGLAMYCPEHSQTSASGGCYFLVEGDSYCAMRCYVDPTFVGGNQCHCGATCQPQGAPDGEGNMRGICTFE
jgi:hypothetical protein